MNVNQEVRLNLSADGIPPRLFMPQGDANSRTIIATLWDGAAPYNVPASAAVMVRFRKPDGTGGLYDATEAGTAVTASGNTVTAPVATQMLAVAGVVQAEIDIYGTGSGKAADRLATFRFAVEVAPSVYPDAQIISSDYFNLIAATISEAIEAAAKADLAKTAAQAAQSAAETAQSGAESAEQGAQAAQAAAENAKTAAQTAQQGAKAAQDAAEDAQAAAEGAKSGAQAAQQGAQAAQQGAQAAQQGAQTAQQGAEAAQDTAEDAQAAAASSAAAAAASAANAATSVEGAVKYNTPQALTDAQKQQARDNINATAPYEAGDNIAITGRVITTKAFPCNPNLLDNWYFGNPVNQRGQTSYTGLYTYTIDRWLTDNTVTVVDGGIKCKRSGRDWLLWQRLEDALSKTIAGRVVTYSALTSAGLLTKTVSLPSLNETWDIYGGNATLGDLSMDMSESAGKKCLRFYSEVDGTEATIIAAKLELGSQQTLAHQENGVWVLNEIPDYGEQLRRCQRYALVLEGSEQFYCGKVYGSDATKVDVFIPTPVTMRTTPVLSTLQNPASIQIATNSGLRTDVSLSVYDKSPNGVDVVALCDTGLSANELAILRISGGKLLLSADL